MSAKGQPIIIKKGKKKGHGGGHGGAWKVAYADFVTAMMAFFLLMWLLNMTSAEKKMQLTTYFKTVTVFQSMGQSFLNKGAAALDSSSPANKQVPSSTLPSGKVVNMSAKQEDLKEKLKKAVEKKLSDVKDQVAIDVFEGGVKIQIMDKDKKPMFPVGSSELTAEGKKILAVIADNIKDLTGSKIAIEGHTDSLAYSSNRYTNWELSTDRASAARKELEVDGLNPDMLAKVAGFAATDPLIKDDPTDPRNRRISILIYNMSKDDQLKGKSLAAPGGATQKEGAPSSQTPPSGGAPAAGKEAGH